MKIRTWQQDLKKLNQTRFDELDSIIISMLYFHTCISECDNINLLNNWLTGRPRNTDSGAKPCINTKLIRYSIVSVLEDTVWQDFLIRNNVS